MLSKMLCTFTQGLCCCSFTRNSYMTTAFRVGSWVALYRRLYSGLFFTLIWQYFGTNDTYNYLEATVNSNYTEYPIIRNGHIRNSAEFLRKFKKRAFGRSNLRNASKNLRNSQCSDFQS